MAKDLAANTEGAQIAPQDDSGHRVNRRLALQSFGVSLGALAGCTSTGGEEVNAAAASAGTSSAGGAGAGSTAGTGGLSSGSTAAWATGGTAAMTAAASYPDPFGSAEATCALTCSVTQGPCWAPSAPVRQDISEGEAGIPVRLVLRVVDASSCVALEGAEVEIWYCNVDGLYSAEDVENPAFCTGNDEHALASYFFRGRAIAGADGKVTFDGCFPGWYSSRSVHIHLVVRPASNAGESTTTNAIAISQLFFPEALTSEIFATVAGYVERGQPDTTFATDNVLSAVDDIEPYVVEYSRMSDGAMLAWKTIAVSSSQQCG